ncbi:MAG: cytochrome c3 family protein [Firmicutes bacterium]|nr:cytochrome c3 family protein [Bacillota bacterium]
MILLGGEKMKIWRTGKRLLVVVLWLAAIGGIAAITDLSISRVASAQELDCFTCHGTPNFGTTKNFRGEIVSKTVNKTKFEKSVHGAFLTCTTCHAGVDKVPHEITPANLKTARDACLTCHPDVYDTYKTSAHGQLTTQNPLAPAPSCADCHGNHYVERTKTAAFRADVPRLCGKCHDNRYEGYLETYHGKAGVLGRKDVATCADCHTAHSMMAVSDRRSTVAMANRVKTCGKCHEGANKNFASIAIHPHEGDAKGYPILFWTKLFFMVLTWSVIAALMGHLFLNFIRTIVEKRRERGGTV